MKDIIIGYGIVGNNLHKELYRLNCEVCDKYKKIFPPKEKYRIAFICVPTELKEDNTLDTSEVENAINENDAEIYVIKSTVPVCFTEELVKNTNKRIIFSPEYYGNTQHCNNYNFDFTILGGKKEDCIFVQNVLQEVYDGRHKFIYTDSKTAELCKFMENSWLAYKVTFCIEFFKICEQYGISYEELRELFILDERVNPSHTFVYRDHPYFDSHCLNKDVPHIANQSNSELLKEIIKINNKNKEKYKNG